MARVRVPWRAAGEPGAGPGGIIFTTMPPSSSTAPAPPRSPRRLVRSAYVLLGTLLACRGAAGDAPVHAPPAAEFVLAAGDSAIWVNSVDGTVQVRGAPIELARVDGRFYELYVADDDRSFEDATFVGQRVYRRDLLRGDSTLVYQDTLVPRLARDYARRHPDDPPLAAGEEPSDEPLWDVESTLDLAEVQGPFVSFDLRTDVRRDGVPPAAVRRGGVIDLRHGGAATLRQLLAGGTTPAELDRRRGLRLRATVDSLSRAGGESASREAALFAGAAVDPRSFRLTTAEGGPALAWTLTTAGFGGGLELPPVSIGEPAWWAEVAPTLPVASAGGARAIWRHGGYEVVVRYDREAGGAQLVLRDSTSREWSVARVPVPATRIFWLDVPAIDSAARHALVRAFDESALYDESVRTAAAPSRGGRSATRLAGWRRWPRRGDRRRPRTPPRPRAPHA